MFVLGFMYGMVRYLECIEVKDGLVMFIKLVI